MCAKCKSERNNGWRQNAAIHLKRVANDKQMIFATQNNAVKANYLWFIAAKCVRAFSSFGRHRCRSCHRRRRRHCRMSTFFCCKRNESVGGFHLIRIRFHSKWVFHLVDFKSLQFVYFFFFCVSLSLIQCVWAVVVVVVNLSCKLFCSFLVLIMFFFVPHSVVSRETFWY